MPIFGSLTVDPKSHKQPRVKALAKEAVAIEKVETLTFTFEVKAQPSFALVPPALHPSLPSYCSLKVRKHYDSPVGAFTIAELCMNARASSIYTGFCLGAFTDNAKAAEWLRDAYGAPVETADKVTLVKRHYGIEARVEKGGEIILDGLLSMPGFISGSDVLYTPNLNYAEVDGALKLVPEEFEYAIKDAKRGVATFRALNLAAFGGAAAFPTNHLPATFTASSLSYMEVRYVLDPGVPAFMGATKVA
ncbi:MAG TPA: hypothetical protein VGN05_03450 [Parvibaculum sp.]|jgi:hypothetical protein